MVHAKPEANPGPGLSVEDCRLQLDRILKSPDFEASARERRFLGFIVEETLSGRGGRIKAYSVAIEVFGRDATFDPQNDPIVRIEAGHLRRFLERYYLTAGRSDPILISIPKGAYVANFSARPMSAHNEHAPRVLAPLVTSGAASWSGKSWSALIATCFVLVTTIVLVRFAPFEQRPTKPELPRLLVERFDALSKNEGSAAIAAGLTQEIIGQLSKFRDIVVLESVETGALGPPPRFVLAGSVGLSANSFRLRVRLINRSDNSILWANSYDAGMRVSDVVAAQEDIAKNVATNLAQTYGAIFQADAALNVANAPDDWSAYACTLSYYAYRASLDQNVLPGVRACLEQAVESFPTYSTGWGLLSQTYIDEVRFRYPFDPVSSQTSIDRALEAARRAVVLDPLNVRGLQAEMFALYLSKEVDAALAVGKRALEINPNDTELMGEYGYRLALSGNWVEGCPLVAEAQARNPGSSAYYESGLALCSYFQGDYPEAIAWIKKTPALRNANYHAIAAAIFAEGGLKADAARERRWLQDNAPGLITNAHQELALRFGSEKDIELLLGSLKKAGLDIKG